MSRATSLGSTPTNHSMCFDSTKNSRHHLARKLSRLDQTSVFLPIGCENPAAAIVAAAADRVWGCQEVLRDQRILHVVYWIAAGNSGWWAFLFSEVQPSVFLPSTQI